MVVLWKTRNEETTSKLMFSRVEEVVFVDAKDELRNFVPVGL
jgi:hypothetical protein